jgi:8-oxo-dGTP pyrophosphatase MutT (NUDIX family)
MNLSQSQGGVGFNNLNSEFQPFTYSSQFSLRHVFRAGAVVWCKNKGKDYYVVFRSHTRPNRGIQIPGGRIEKHENVGHTILREVYEETGLRCDIVCPLGFIYFQNEKDNYSNMQTYFIIKPIYPIDVQNKWKYTDKDSTKQELECWCVPVEKPADFLASGQSQVIDMFRKWLEDHKKPPRQSNRNENDFSGVSQGKNETSDSFKSKNDKDFIIES